MHNQSILVLKALMLLMFILLASTGCFSRNLLRLMSTVYDEPIEKVNSVNGIENEWYRVCVSGHLKKTGYGDYTINIKQKHFDKARNKCRNNQFVSRIGKTVCATEKIPIIRIRKNDILWECEVLDYISTSDYFVLITGEKRRQLIIQDSIGQELVEVNVDDILKDTNPIAYGLLPFTFVLDIVTAPAQMLGNYIVAGELYVEQQPRHDTPSRDKIYARQ